MSRSESMREIRALQPRNRAVSDYSRGAELVSALGKNIPTLQMKKSWKANLNYH